MAHTRFNALQAIENRIDLLADEVSEVENGSIASYFGQNVFNDEAMRRFLPENAYLSVKAAIQSGQKLSREVADVVAAGMKEWAQSKGCTHFAHWFQPLTGKTAEKHDSFFTMTYDGRVIEEFTGAALVQQEPDGSSFPSGGMRSTFEARGYTVWDPSSPAFIMDVGSGKTLCIPTIFVTYDGLAQDYKLPLLRSQAFLDKAAVPVCQLFNPNITKVTATLGWEQEYFVVDEALFNARPDLVMTGRTLLGRPATKHQQLEDHYFGSIPERVYHFMRDLEMECHRLGIPVRTRHNEVAPGQYEVAPVFEEINVSVDHNQLLMDVMERVARRHRLRVLLHEKPFAGINGSGKHNNWSLMTNTGVNLLSPGDSPSRNLRFLTFFVNTIMAVYRYADLLRASIAHAGNDHRLGANEAPPAIISVFIGEAMTRLLNRIADGKKTDDAAVKRALDLISKLPNLERDNTDRNRTSPFAFTGNKFEIRAVGSSQNCAAPMTVMNTMVGLQLLDFKRDVDRLMAKGIEKDEAILMVLKKYIRKMKPILFEGNNYSEEWKQEAARRGLSNHANTPEALAVLASPQGEEFYTRSGVLSKRELEALLNVQLHAYCTKIDIEAKTLIEMIQTLVVPATVRYQTELAQNLVTLKEAGLQESAGLQREILHKIEHNLGIIREGLHDLQTAQRKARAAEDLMTEARIYCDEVKMHMERIRCAADELEVLVDDQYWPLVKYRELLFIR
ncbi:MAG: glutamine synthetase III [Saprospiraceae bacterium]|nr:glutamine synthetase III [Saprospiraceae bacterium]MDW8483196.1 glutamine synthetase III [Saprospiraceae bacterium]